MKSIIAHSSVFIINNNRIKICCVFKDKVFSNFISIYRHIKGDSYNKIGIYNIQKDKMDYKSCSKNENTKILKEDKLIILNQFEILVNEIIIQDIIV